MITPVVKKSDIALAFERQKKIARSIIRLKHSVAADAELNQALPALYKEFNRSVLAGELPDDQVLEDQVRKVLGV